MKYIFSLVSCMLLLIVFFTNSCAKDDNDVDDICLHLEDYSLIQYCYDNFDMNSDGKVSLHEAKKAETIEISNVHSLNGLEYFTNLRTLAANGDFSEVNLSGNPLLLSLSLKGKLTEIDISHNPDLTYVNLASNALSMIDVSNNQNLVELDICDQSSANTKLYYSSHAQALRLMLRAYYYEDTYAANLKRHDFIRLKDIITHPLIYSLGMPFIADQVPFHGPR